MAGNLVGGAALGPVFDLLLKTVISATGSVVKFNSKIQSLKDTLMDLAPVFEDIERLNTVLEHRHLETDMFIDRLKKGQQLVEKCIKIKRCDVFRKIYYEKKLTDFENSLSKFFLIQIQARIYRESSRTVSGLSDLGEKLDRVLTIVEGNTASRSIFGGVSSSVGLPEVPDFVVGLDVPLQELKMMVLKEDGEQVVVLSAPAGCGKSTLAAKLCHDDQIKDRYRGNIFFVSISETPNFKVIVQKILGRKNPSCAPCFQSDKHAAEVLHEFLRHIEPYPILLVLDDVWCGSATFIQKFIHKIPGYKILVTSRSDFPGFFSTYKLNPLSDQHARILFHHSAFGMGQHRVGEDLIDKVLRGCGGFPLALKVVGESLRGRHEMTWKSRIRKWSGGSILDTNHDLLRCLESSLDALDDKANLKDCYLDLGSFPEDHRIPATVLVDMWLELYCFDENDVFDNLFELATRNLVNLVLARKDVLDDHELCNEHYAVQHDLLRELALHLDNREPIGQRRRLTLHINGNDLPIGWIEHEQQPLCAHLLSISTDETFALNWHDMQFPNVEVLLLHFQTRIYSLPHFVEKMRQLKVLILTNNGYCASEIENFSLLGHLISLKRIRLEHVKIASISLSIFQLRNLRKISLVMCDFQEAFQNFHAQIPELWPNLVELNIDHCNDMVELPAALCDLVQLKKLSITYCQELVALPDEIGNLTNLEVLRLHSCTKLEELPESVGGLHKLRLLDISDCVEMDHMPSQIGELYSLRKINMRGCRGLFELPASVFDLVQLETVICDEATADLWKPYNQFLNVNISVLKKDANLSWLHNFQG